MGLIRRAAVAYYRANVDAWMALRRHVPPVLDPWLALGVAQFTATVALVAAGRSGAAMVVAAAGLVLLAVQYAVDG